MKFSTLLVALTGFTISAALANPEALDSFKDLPELAS